MDLLLEIKVAKIYSGNIKLNIESNILLLSLLPSGYEHMNEQGQIKGDVLRFHQALFYVCTQTKGTPHIIVS